jgi:DNA-binding LacI/PurR family transcriptional regulator
MAFALVWFTYSAQAKSMNSPNEAASLGRGDPPGETPSPRKLPDFTRTITMAQIAKAAGVSQGAISSLLNDRDYGIRVSEKTRERVFRVCREMGYMPNDLRAVVRMYPELGEFCLLIARELGNAAEEPALARVASAAVSAVPKDCRSLTISRYDTDVDYIAHPDKLPQPVRVGIVSKFIAFGHLNSSLITTITRRGLPCVMLGATQNLLGVVCYVPDYEQASLVALEYLGGLGHQRIAIISGPFGTTEPAVIEMNRGVRLAFEKMHIPLEAQHVVYGDLHFGAGTAAAETLLTRQPAPTAVFCMSDAVATGVIAYAHSKGIKVPEQLSVIGCGDDPICKFNLPPLTTVRLPYEDMATRGVADIDQLIRYTGLPEPKTSVMPVELVERGSCGKIG